MKNLVVLLTLAVALAAVTGCAQDESDLIMVGSASEALTLQCGTAAQYQQAFLAPGSASLNMGTCNNAACVTAITCPTANNANPCPIARQRAEANAIAACNDAVSQFSNGTTCGTCPAGQTGCERSEAGGCSGGGASICSATKLIAPLNPPTTYPAVVYCQLTATGAANANKVVACAGCACGGQMAGSGVGSGSCS